ncbi:MAG: DinB family protein [Acidobacteria bacterium]|nr:DinB family protein [Acidobacteriota bacterium]
MRISEALLVEFDTEMAHTRKTLERLPEARLAWKPHEKSPSMGWLANHVAQLPGWTVMALTQNSIDIAPVGQSAPQMPELASRQEILEAFDKNVRDARAAIASAKDDDFVQPWTLLKGGQALFTLSRMMVIRNFIMNHSIHHRAQLGVYLRLNNVPVPAIYGPSADEGSF